MEDRMNLTVSWQLELVSNWPNTLEHQVGTKVLETKFVHNAALDRVLDIWLELDKYPVTHTKFPFLAMFIFLMLHALLGTLKVVLNQFCHG